MKELLLLQLQNAHPLPPPGRSTQAHPVLLPFLDSACCHQLARGPSPVYSLQRGSSAATAASAQGPCYRQAPCGQAGCCTTTPLE